ncbi:YolD-like family protein [Staphylococcus saprophyticus]|uniref:YolD-like family protein n=1 Tax=Staphylococcus saprophyticus TaxID=29385 RepID=UPI001F3119FD|nr:YolD-like family protein [Staphylococcus saprophyticus]MCE5132267.1 YolD-like family protein [Staphylococcus saprophyticus]
MKVINPNAPDKYKYETDYRKIPREYLNPRIPKGRGIVKWQAFKTVPEQYEILDQYIEDQNKIPMPLLSDDQLEEINEKVHEKIQTNRIAEISYWENGYISGLNCYIKKIDTLENIMLIKRIDNQSIVKLSLNNIVSVY